MDLILIVLIFFQVPFTLGWISAHLKIFLFYDTSNLNCINCEKRYGHNIDYQVRLSFDSSDKVFFVVFSCFVTKMGRFFEFNDVQHNQNKTRSRFAKIALTIRFFSEIIALLKLIYNINLQ